MGSSTAAQKAHQTRRKLKARTAELMQQGMSRPDAEAQARREHRLGAKVTKRGAASPAAAGARPTGTTPVSPTSGGPASRIASKLKAVADPADPASGFAATARLGQTWTNDGKRLTVWTPGGLKKVKLKIEPKPGPFTPTEEIHDILGQPDLLFTIGVAIENRELSLIEGPTGTAKTTAYRWLAKQLNWNFFVIPMHPDITAADLIGEHLPAATAQSQLIIRWIWGSVSKAVRASHEHPTLAVFDELNRGRVQVLAKLYQLLDDSRQLVIDNLDSETTPGTSEVLRPGEHLYFGATQNPVDFAEDDVTAADHIGVQELDPALRRRFSKQLQIGYPEEIVEAEALCRRVPDLKKDEAMRMVKVATAVRQSPEIRYPISFPDMVSWATGLPYYGWEKAAEVAVVTKAHPSYRGAILNLLDLKPTVAGAP